MSIEAWASNHQHTVELLGAAGSIFAAIGTIAAVWVSLNLARRGEQVRLDAYIGHFSASDNKTVRGVIGLGITNKAMRTAHVSSGSFDWSIPFHRNSHLLNANFVNAILLRHQHITVESGKIEIVDLGEIDVFEQLLFLQLAEIRNELKWFKNIRISMIGAKIQTDDGFRFNVEITRIVKDMVRQFSTTSK